jgi:RND superfamily putative drug exporter
LHGYATSRYGVGMALLLQRLGRFSFRRRRLMLTSWIAALVAVVAAAGLSGGSFVSSFSVPGTDSQEAIELLNERVPDASADGATGRIVFAAPEGSQFTGAQQEAISDAVTAVTGTAGVASASDPFDSQAISADKRVAYSQVTFSDDAGSLAVEEQEAVERAANGAEQAGVQVLLSGDAVPAAVGHGIPPELIGIFVAMVVLFGTFGSLLAAGMPLLTAAIGVGIGLTGITALAAVVELSSAVTSLASMLGLAVGIDYALFVISRYRTEVHEGMDLEEAAGHTVGTAGSAVVFAGATVIIALVALAITGIPFLTAMGIAAAGTVAIAVLVAITLVPALLGFAGARALKGKRFEAAADQPHANTLGARWVAYVVRHRIAAIALVVVTTVGLSAPLLHMRLGLPDDSSAAADTQERQAYDLLTDGFGPGFNGPLTVVADIPKGADAAETAATIRARLSGLDDVSAVTEPQLTPDNTLVITTVVPSSGPSDAATKDLVRAIRAQKEDLLSSTGAELYVTGTTAVNIDVADRTGSALVPYLAVVVALALVLLMIAFRSVLVPLTAIGGFLLSIGAALGAMVAVFQDGTLASLFGVEPAPIVSLLPALMIGILFGLAMDYQVFLVSRMHEAHAHGDAAQDAVRHGFRQSARVVTAAALIMVSVFAGFILPDDAIIKSIGFGLTAGILIDAFLIRMTLIPALMSLLGDRAWWLPRRLGRVLPDVDIEGKALERRDGRVAGAAVDDRAAA